MSEQEMDGTDYGVDEQQGAVAVDEGTEKLRRYPIGSDKAKRVQGFFECLTKRAEEARKKQREDEWDKARAAYCGSVPDKPRDSMLANLWRSKVDTQGAYLDSDVPRVRWYASEPAAMDKRMELIAKVDESAHEYISREQNFRRELSYIRHSADICGCGFGVIRPDMRKGLPELIYLTPEQVVADENSMGCLERASWVAYCEYRSPEELQAEYPDVNLSKLFKASEHIRDGRDNDDLLSDTGYFRRCKVWRIFARNDAAMYDNDPSYAEEAERESKPHTERFKDNPITEEPRRYLLMVEGLEGPIVDIDGWPMEYLCDDDEWPIVSLVYNPDGETIYGFSDYRHERALLDVIDSTLKDIQTKCGIEGLKLGGATGTEAISTAINQFLSAGGVQFLPGLIDEVGNPKVRVLDFKAISPSDLPLLNTMIEMYDQVSMQPRAARGAETPGKTATATQIENDRQAARATVRLRKFEKLIATVARLSMQMAHVMIPKHCEISGPYGPAALMQDAPLTDENGVMLDPDEVVKQYVNYDVAVELLKNPKFTLTSIGMEAIVGPELAKEWEDWPDEPAPGYTAMILRGLRVNVERGSTQRQARIQKVAMFREVFAEMISPVAQMLNAPTAMIDAIERVLEMMDINEFDRLIEILNTHAGMMAMAPQAQPGQPAPGNPLPAGPPSDHQAGAKQVTEEEMLNAPV